MVVIDKKMTKTVTLQANALPLGNGIKMAKVCYSGLPCTGTKAQYLTIEARIRGVQFDNGLTGDGVVIHDVMMSRGAIGAGNPCFFNTQSGWAVPADATPGDWKGKPACNSGGKAWPNYGLGNAQFGAGKTYNNALRKVSVKVVKMKGSTYIVEVTRSN